MQIEWIIEKKRGNYRPVLKYSVALEEHEKAMALPPVSILSAIPKPEADHKGYCYPGQHERSDAPEKQIPKAFHTLDVPSHQGHSWTHCLRLPWRADNEYPEVEASFQQLRCAFEKELESAYASTPVKISQSLKTSGAAKTTIAPGVLAERFLRLAEKGKGSLDQGSESDSPPVRSATRTV
ncbi:hypothetical protein LJC71_07830 [Desulfosarcina sp. OttesenSCG-928-A07]|nr:hypothetical protein [Desulfosarcina sp. OttesenSCG-928-G17]MDL2329634.1 hypothetical protein [Desulfosarcina sp. OttesenSCG-928-A07]